jgi:hypothetical protein
MTSRKMTSPTHSLLSLWVAWSLLVLLLLAACSPGQASPSSSPRLWQQPTQQTSPGPAPVATLLTSAPRDCPSGPLLTSRTLPGFDTSVTGKGSVWESGLPANATLNLDELGYTPWPATKILWPIGSDFPHTVTVRVTNRKTGTEAWWDIGEGAPAPKKPVRPLLLNPQGNKGGKPPLWGTILYLPQTGCYEMTVSWPDGQWRLLFTVGR